MSGVGGNSSFANLAKHQITARDVTRKNGPAPEGPSRSKSTMLHKPNVPDQQGVRDFLTEGVTTLTAVEMNQVLLNCAYEHQRGISDTHVAVLADLMKRGRWQPKSQIDFAVLDGQYILINGYHRAYAQVRSGKSIKWNIALHTVTTKADLRALYYAFDTNVRPRSAGDIVRASEFGEVHGVTDAQARSLFSAAPYIASKFRVAAKERNFLVFRQADRKLEIATEYAKAAARYAAAIEGAPASMRRRLVSGAVTAVAVATFRYQSETAWQFWSGVAHMDGLKRGDARLALATDLLSREIKSGGGERAVVRFAPPIIAWNAFFNDRELKQIRVGDNFSPVIDGTPFDGKPIKQVA